MGRQPVKCQLCMIGSRRAGQSEWMLDFGSVVLEASYDAGAYKTTKGKWIGAGQQGAERYSSPLR